MGGSDGTSLLSTKINLADTLSVFNRNSLPVFPHRRCAFCATSRRFTSLGAVPTHPRVQSLLPFSPSQVELET